MFNITSHKGFQFTFPNGWIASVQWGIGNYCSNKDTNINVSNNPSNTFDWKSNSAEFYMYNNNFHAENDLLVGCVSVTNCSLALAKIATFPANCPDTAEYKILVKEVFDILKGT